jgi:DNA replicative helicase MCM subunit Mcm2 (Cdc46/Mcm family)
MIDFLDLLSRYPENGRRLIDTVPITTRQLEALIRLCQARAKACLRDFVLKEDALDVVELMTYSVEQVHTNEIGSIDVLRGGAGGTSHKKIRKAFLNEVYRVIGSNGIECTIDDLRRIAHKLDSDLHDFPILIENLRSDGFLLKKSNGKYQVF